MSTIHTPARRWAALRATPWIPAGVAVVVVVASLGSALVAWVTRVAGASGEFEPLDPVAFVPLTAIGVLLGASGWAALRRRRRAVAVLRIAVPAVLVLSWIPDLILGIEDTRTGTSWTAVAGLMVMHVVVVLVSIPIFARVMPVTARPVQSEELTRSQRL